MPSHLQSLYSCLPPCLASVSIQASIHSIKLVSTCCVPGAVPSAGHQAGLSQHLVAPWGTLGSSYMGLFSCVTLSPAVSLNHPSLHSPPMTPPLLPLGVELFLYRCYHGNLTNDSYNRVAFGNHQFLSGVFSH